MALIYHQKLHCWEIARRRRRDCLRWLWLYLLWVAENIGALTDLKPRLRANIGRVLIGGEALDIPLDQIAVETLNRAGRVAVIGRHDPKQSVRPQAPKHVHQGLEAIGFGQVPLPPHPDFLASRQIRQHFSTEKA